MSNYNRYNSLALDDDDDEDLPMGSSPNSINSQGYRNSSLKSSTLSSSNPASGSSQDHNEESYSPIAMYAFMINYILGVGVLGIPYAFYKSGVIFASIFLGFVSIIASMTMGWIVESGSRAEALTRLLKREYEGDTKHLDAAGIQLSHLELTRDSKNRVPEYIITKRKFELNQLAHMFLGKTGKQLYEFTIAMYMYGALWGYSAVFGSSIVELLPLYRIFDGIDGPCDLYAESVPFGCLFSYWMTIAVLAAFVIPLTLRDLTEQVFIQALLCIFRFVALFTMMLTVLSAMYRRPFDPDDHSITTPPYVSPDTPYFALSAFGLLAPVAVFSQIVHHSAPGLSQPCSDKSKLKSVYNFGFTTTWAFYSLVGVICALYFGSGTSEVVSLNWKTYTGPTDAPTWWALLISLSVVLFPPVDIVSSFPLNAITLGNNIYQALPQDWRENRPNMKKICRLLAAVPPLVASLFIWKLSTILQINGLFSFAIVYLFPGAIQYSSTRFCRAAFPAAWKTTYTSSLSSSFYAIFVILMGSVLLGNNAFSVLYNLFNNNQEQS